MKKGLITKIFIALIAFSLCLMFYDLSQVHSDIVKGVTTEKIKRIKPGMALEEVLIVLGKPYDMDILRSTHNISCNSPKTFLQIPVSGSVEVIKMITDIFSDTNYCCDGYRDDLLMPNRTFTLIYTRPVKLFSYPMLWVHFDGDYKVTSVYAKEYMMLDDACIYSIDENDGAYLSNDEVLNKYF